MKNKQDNSWSFPVQCGLEAILWKKICTLKRSGDGISIFRFKEIGLRHGLRLEEIFFGVNLYIDDKMTPVSTPLYSSIVNRKRLAIMKWENKKTMLHYIKPYHHPEQDNAKKRHYL